MLDHRAPPDGNGLRGQGGRRPRHVVHARPPAAGPLRPPCRRRTQPDDRLHGALGSRLHGIRAGAAPARRGQGAPRDPDRRGGEARGGTGRDADPLDLQRQGDGADAARAGRRHVRRDAGQHGGVGHSIDFHAGSLAPDVPMRTIRPGESLVYTFTAQRSGIWMYHCSTMPMSTHIAAGMAGAVVIEPEGLAPVAHSYVIAQSEIYLGAQGDPVNADKVAAEAPDAVVFNGAVEPVRRPPARRPRRRAGADLGARPRPEPRRRPSTSSAGSSTPSTRRAPTSSRRAADRSTRPARRQGARRRSTSRPRRAASSSSPSRRRATTRWSATSWSTRSAGLAASSRCADTTQCSRIFNRRRPCRSTTGQVPHPGRGALHAVLSRRRRPAELRPRLPRAVGPGDARGPGRQPPRAPDLPRGELSAPRRPRMPPGRGLLPGLDRAGNV